MTQYCTSTVVLESHDERCKKGMNSYLKVKGRLTEETKLFSLKSLLFFFIIEDLNVRKITRLFAWLPVGKH